MDAGIFSLYLLKRNCRPLLSLKYLPLSLFLCIAAYPFIYTRIHRLHCSPNSGREESSGGDLCKAWCYMRSTQE